MNALTSGQIAHAYLFCGPRGTGKTSAAKLFAKAVNCLNLQGAEPCNVCDVCLSITRGNNVDVEEIDAASNRGVDEIRELRDKVHYAPTSVRRKVYIVDEVHMLTPEAFNALLKTLEEPPEHALFLLATTEAHRIPNTIISRCQRFDFHRISTETMVERLQEVVEAQGWDAETGALWKLAEAADGGLRDALGLLEQTGAFGKGRIDEAQVAAVIGGVDTAGLLALVGELAAGSYLNAILRLSGWYANGKDANRIAFDLLQVLRDLFIVMLSQTDEALGGKPVESYRQVAAGDGVTTEWLLAGVTKLGELYTQLRYVEQPRLALESCLLSLAATPRSQVAAPVIVQATPVTPVTQTPVVAKVETPTEPPAKQIARANARGNAAGGPDRKRETLERLYGDRDEEAENEVRIRWNDVLNKVKSDRIQTHAWLAHGEVAFVTPSAIVLSFASRIHREAVMKAADRKVIEAAFETIIERNVQLFALLKSDLDEFLALRLTPLESASTDTVTPQTQMVERAKALFDEDKLIIEE